MANKNYYFEKETTHIKVRVDDPRVIPSLGLSSGGYNGSRVDHVIFDQDALNGLFKVTLMDGVGAQNYAGHHINEQTKIEPFMWIIDANEEGGLADITKMADYFGLRDVFDL